ncbi:MAG: tetratricopeptide repeat protein, partial [Polyangiaceae bacterium]|nr:tetratricopeptide repeat protein [Polyangiaceae bacterium]
MAHDREEVRMKDQPMNRAELERLDREALVRRAEAAGVTRARVLTRAELVDELVLRTSVDRLAAQRARGLFGRARDLLARVVEQGLHLPDAADRIRAMGGAPIARPSAPAALPTVTLAEIYVAQGHRARAIETLERVLAREPDHAAAGALLAQLRDVTYPVPQPRLPPEDAPPSPARALDDAGLAPRPAPAQPGATAQVASAPRRTNEPAHMLDDAPLPPRYDVDECVAIPVDPSTIYAYWEVRDRTVDY